MTKIIIISMILISLNQCANKKRPGKSIFYKGIKKEVKYARTNIKDLTTKIKLNNIIQGDIVKHDFIIKNDSTKKIKIKKAYVACCVHITSYTKEITPGGFGIISINLYTDIYGGRTISDTVRAVTNSGKTYEINIESRVIKFADIKPYKIRLKGVSNSEISASSIIIPEKKFPFKITKVRSRKGNNIRYSISEIKIRGKDAYKVTVFNNKNSKGKYRDKLFLETDSTVQKELRLRVSGEIY